MKHLWRFLLVLFLISSGGCAAYYPAYPTVGVGIGYGGYYGYGPGYYRPSFPGRHWYGPRGYGYGNFNYGPGPWHGYGGFHGGWRGPRFGFGFGRRW